MTEKINDWKQIEEANDLIQTIELKGKEYAQVKDRVIAFRRVHPLGTIETDHQFSENYIMFEATIRDGDMVLAKGHSREYLKNEFALEKAETSAIGRALGFCGFGITNAIASAEDIENMDKEQIFDEPPVHEVASKLQARMSKQEYADFLNCTHVLELEKLPVHLLMSMLKYYEDKHTSNR